MPGARIHAPVRCCCPLPWDCRPDPLSAASLGAPWEMVREHVISGHIAHANFVATGKAPDTPLTQAADLVANHLHQLSAAATTPAAVGPVEVDEFMGAAGIN